MKNKKSRDIPHKCAFSFCEDNKLVDSHVIPQAIHHFSTRSENPEKAVLISNAPDSHPKKCPTGIYDQFVCAQHEKIFQPWDNEAIEFFRNFYNLYNNLKNGISSELRINYKKKFSDLKLFFMSVLWRAHHSKQDFYKNVRIENNVLYKRLENLLTQNDPGNWQDFSVILECFSEDCPASSIMLQPFKGKFESMFFYTFYMAGFKIHIKCDLKELPERYKDQCLNVSSETCRVKLIPFQDSEEYKRTIDACNRPNNDKRFQKNDLTTHQ